MAEEKRTEQGMWQGALAKACGISQAALSEIARGKTVSLRGETLMRMEKALHEDAEYIRKGRHEGGSETESKQRADDDAEIESQLGVMLLLSDRIRAARKRAQLSQGQLAKQCHVSQATLSRLENGKSLSLRGKTLVRMAEALAQSPQWLSRGDGAADQLSPATPLKNDILSDLRLLTTEERRIIIRMIRALVIDR